VSLRPDGALTEESMTPAARWRAEPAVRFYRWDADTVVYVPGTAATHWLETDAAMVFLALQASTYPPTVLELAAALGPGCVAADRADLEALLLQLNSLGIASIAPAPR
jgi:hypothetical protein